MHLCCACARWNDDTHWALTHMNDVHYHEGPQKPLPTDHLFLHACYLRNLCMHAALFLDICSASMCTMLEYAYTIAAASHLLEQIEME